MICEMYSMVDGEMEPCIGDIGGLVTTSYSLSILGVHSGTHYACERHCKLLADLDSPLIIVSIYKRK